MKKKPTRAKVAPPKSRKQGKEKAPAKTPEAEGTFIRTKAEYMHYLSRFMSQEETRYYLNGINVQKHAEKGLLLTATNGHIMGVFHDPDGVIEGCDNVTIPMSKQTIAATNPRKKRTIPLDFYHADGVIYLAPTALEKADVLKIDSFHVGIEPAKFIDGTYPDWPRVLPKELGPQGKTSFNPEYLQLFAFGAVKLQVSLHFNKEISGPIAVRNPNYSNFMGVMMPMTDKTTEVFPPFIVKLQAESAKREAAALAKKQKAEAEALKKRQAEEKKALRDQQAAEKKRRKELDALAKAEKRKAAAQPRKKKV